MTYLRTLFALFNFKTTEHTMVSSLYSLSQRSMIALMVFSLLLTYYLYPSLSYSIIYWEICVIILAFIRLYLAKLFQNHLEKFTLSIWYKLFLFFTFCTASLFSILGFSTIFYVEEMEQVFIAATLIGFTSGAMSSLFPDVRIVVAYISIVVLPLIVSLITLNTFTSTILALLVILYYVIQILIVINIYTQTKELEDKKEEIFKEQKNIKHFFEQAPLGIFAYDLDLNVTDCSQAFLNLFALERKDIIGSNLTNLPDKRPIETIQKALTDGVQTYIGPYKSIKNIELWVEAKCFALYDNASDVTGGVGIIENKTNEYKAVTELKFLAQHDPLTELLNRRGFMDYMKELVSTQEHKSTYSLLFYMDLDQFKGINDSLGHTVGDKVLLLVSQRLGYMLDNRCEIVRLGGDEFIVIVPYISKNEKDIADYVSEYEKKLTTLFDDPFMIDDLHLRISASIGMIVIEPNSWDIEEIIRHADITMYQAKNSNSKISYYSEALDKKQK